MVDYVPGNWVSNTTSTGTYVWDQWLYSTATTTGGWVYPQQQITWTTWEELEEDRLAREAREEAMRDAVQRDREERNARHLAQMERMEGAQERAMELLLQVLTPEEQPFNNRIRVVGSEGGLFDIRMTTVHGNIYETDEHECALGSVCVAPRMYDDDGLALPLADGWLGQYLAIKFQEPVLRAAGNWSGRRPCRVENPRDVMNAVAA